MTEETTPHLSEEEQALESLDPKPDDQGGDPLDEITDIDELRKKTKGYRSAFKKYRTKAKEVPEPKEEVPLKPAEQPTDVVRKSDLERVATNHAKELVGDEVAEVWDELVKIPLAGYDPLDPKSIASNIKERYAIYRARNPKKDGPEDTSHLKETTAQKGTGGQAPKDPPSKIKTPSKPDSWYPKKDA